jgi:copper chaperone NosL
MERLRQVPRLLLGLAAILLVGALYLPIWRIELDAPQYPEGLMMQIFASKLGGDVEIINGLNHYIGMQTLHAGNFIEFTVLPYIIGTFIVFTLIALWLARPSILKALIVSFILFGIVAMIDFWRWEYDYGHNLNPNAAIQVPGMSYQPPLIGFKQLLNFGAYSIPDLGGWCFIMSGMLMVAALIVHIYPSWKARKMGKIATPLLLVALLSACSHEGPKPIKLNNDLCEFCKMTISDGRFGAELITTKGRTYTFDDLGCMLRYSQENRNAEVKNYFIHRFDGNNELIPAESAFYLSSDSLNSPMGGNYAAFASEDAAQTFAAKLPGELLRFNDINK